MPVNNYNYWAIKKQEVPQNGLLAFFKFNNNYKDSSGNNWNGTLNGSGVSFETCRKNKENNCLYFNENSTRARINTDLSLSGLTKMSMSSWVKIGDNNNNNDLFRFMCQDGVDSGGNRNVNFIIKTKESKIIFIVYLDNGNSSNYILKSFEDDRINWSNKWFNLLFTWDSELENNKSISIFLNSVEKELNGDSGENGDINIISNNATFSIGGNEIGNEDCEDVFIDDCIIYNRVLTNEEINKIYNY